MADKKKHPGMILAIDADYCDRFFTQGFNALALSRFMDGLPAYRTTTEGKTIPYWDDLAGRVSLRERHRLEFDPRFLQPLNYIVLKQKKKVATADLAGQFCKIKTMPTYSSYYRKKGVGEDRLSDKMSVGWGGHTELASIKTDEAGVFHYIATAGDNIFTELAEEIRLLVAGLDGVEVSAEQLPTVFKGFIYDMSDDVGRHHLALVWEIELPESLELQSREDVQKLGEFYTPEELANLKAERGDLFENWSNIVIDQLGQEGWDLLGTDDDPVSKVNADGVLQRSEEIVHDMTGALLSDTGA